MNASRVSVPSAAVRIEDPFQGYEPLCRALLAERGIQTVEEAEAFLNPDYVLGTHDPFLLADMEKAVERILAAIRSDERIAIYADYDHDGIPGSVVLYDFFRKAGYGNIEVYIPHRHFEGYGLNPEALAKLAENGTKLIITVDCGIADVENVRLARELGMDVIVTDHHLPQEKLPDCVAVVNPKCSEAYPYKMLCGAAVAWKLVQALMARGDFKLPVGFDKWLLDMVGIATLADMVPLTGENRVLARYGLTVLRKTRRPGLRKLFSTLKIRSEHIVEDDITFMVTPRINAASRMGNAYDAWKLLAAEDEAEAEALCAELGRVNDERKGLVASMVKQIRKHFADRADLPPVIVAGNPEWRPSLLGLAANTLMEEHGRPVFLWGRSGSGILKGSCRSNGADLVALMGAVPAGTFIEFGGHAFSGGFSVPLDQVDLLEAALSEAYGRTKVELAASAAPTAGKLSLSDVSWKTYSIVEKFAPFGCDNPKPVFEFENVTIRSSKTFGKEKNHSELSFTDGSRSVPVPAISFFSDIAESVKAGDTVTLRATLEKSVFKSYPELRLRIVSI
jgi:single-stranded-DNA-specific exonuclease